LLSDFFDLLIADEAFQVPASLLLRSLRLVSRAVLVGDPGQIGPVVPIARERWLGRPHAPFLPAPLVMGSICSDSLTIELDYTWRLPADSAAIVKSAFYPTPPFVSRVAPGSRRLILGAGGTTRMDTVLNRIRAGESLNQVELDPGFFGCSDEELIRTMTMCLDRLLEWRLAEIEDDDGRRPVEPGMIAIACAYRHQVTAVRGALPPAYAAIRVDTSDGLQGMQRPFVVVYHPTTGQLGPTEFHVQPGRLCVRLSRHRLACTVFTRAGLEDRLRRSAFEGERTPGSLEDHEVRGWETMLRIQEDHRGMSAARPAPSPSRSAAPSPS
jgi:hypothetical protein